MPARLRRIVTIPVATAVVLVADATPALAHGIGGRADLPVPLSYFVVGAAIAVVASFVGLAALWPEPRLQDLPRQRPLRGPWRAVRITLGWIGLVLFGVTILAGRFDGGESDRNLAPIVVWIGLWLVVPFLGSVLGNFWRWLSPWHTLAGWIGRDRPERTELAARLGVWPATVGFVAFTWLELVSRHGAEPATLAVAAVGYTLAVLAMAWWLGPSSGLASGGVFENYTGLLSSIAPFGFPLGDDLPADIPVHRGWLRALPHLAVRPGLTAFVIAMIGTVSYDGMSGTEWWIELTGDRRRETWFATLALLATVAVIGAVYLAAALIAGRLARSELGGWEIAARFAHTLVPIALAYAVAHYFTLVLFEGQLAFSSLSDPLGRGWDLLGTAGWRPVAFLSPRVVWYVQVATIVSGHVAGVVLAHDRALADFGPEGGVRSQYAMLALMVTLTSLGLLILAG